MFHVVDDDAAVRETYADLLMALGYQVKVFATPRSYLDFVRSPEFVMPLATITNVGMPGMNGYEMMQEVHAFQPMLKFVVATGSPPLIDHAYKSKACMYLNKPFHIDTLKSITDKLSRCIAHGASREIGCAGCDHRDRFHLDDWSCPHPLAL